MCAARPGTSTSEVDAAGRLTDDLGSSARRRYEVAVACRHVSHVSQVKRMNIKQMMLVAATACLLAGAAQADDKAANPQQNRMTACNQQATGKKGDERKAFMSACLSGKEVLAAPAAPPVDKSKMTPGERMKACNQEATGKKGDERKAFMSQCLKKQA